MATAGGNTKQLRENLANYEAQLHQVEAALTNDPANEELLKLKTDLTEVIQLTQDLLLMVPEPKSKSSVLYDWKPGDPCRALWSDNGKHYNAVVDMVSEDGETCTVTFDGYGSTEIIKLADLRPQGWEEDGGGGAKGAGPMKKKKVSEPNAKQRKVELREMKKKKAQKKLARSQEHEQFREHEKQKWKSFTTKSSQKLKGPLNSKQKKSIFAVPDSLEGRVGVGTCNVGGKPMTDFSAPKTYGAKI